MTVTTLEHHAYGIRRRLDLPFDQAMHRTREALKAQGFGVLTEIDVKATMKAKLDKDMEQYVILGACNPPLAHRAIETDRAIGLLLPCNVVVREAEGGTVVEAMDPEAAMNITKDQAIADVASEAKAKLEAALNALTED